MASSEKATNSMQHVPVKTKSKHRTLGWLTIRRPRTKNKYVLQDAEPHNGHHPDISARTKTDEELEEDVPTLLERLKIAESARMDTHSLVTLQRHLIDVLRRENGALRLLRLQVDQLKKENGELKGELQKHQPINGLTNGENNGTNNHKTVESLEEELASLRTENEKLRKAKDNEKSNGGTKDTSKGKKSAAKANRQQQKTNGTATLTNGLTNGYHSSQSEEEDDSSNQLSTRLGNGSTTTNGSSVPRDQTVEENSPPPSAAPVANQRPALVDGNDVGAGTSGTSLVTVTCLIRALGNFLDCDEILQERMKAHMAAKGVDLRLKQWVSSEDHNMLTIVLCRSGSDNVKDIENAMEGISSDAEVVLVVLHLASADAKRKDPQTESLGVPAIANVCLVVDMFFSKRDGLYRCEQNDRAMGRLYRLFEMLC